MPADRAELPFLEAIHIREGLTGRAPDDEVHDKEVMRVILIKIYRLFVIITRTDFSLNKVPLLSKKQEYEGCT
jgi:hypothetical protein